MIDEALTASACQHGLHRARRVRLVWKDTTIRSTCRDCGCDLVRTQATKRWYYSGPLGAV